MSNESDPRNTWSLDREIVLSRVVNAPRAKVFEAWTNAEHLCQWFGPAGFTIENIECDVRVGGVWRFVMVAPELLVIDHGSDLDDDPSRFRTTITFDEQSCHGAPKPVH